MAVEVTQGAATAAQRNGSTAEQWVFMAEDAPASNRDLLGGKGAGLAAMTQAGLPVPPAFTITTAACNAFQNAGGQFPAGLWDQTLAALKQIEQKSGRKLGDAANPLLVSVRSGARESMPGMMDTVLNLGLNDETVAGPGAPDQQRALRLGRLSPLRADVRPHRARRPGEKLDHVFDAGQDAPPAPSRTPTSTPTSCARSPSSSRTLVQARDGPAVPDRRQRAARAGHQGRLQLVDGQARRRLPQPVQDPARPRHGRQRGDDGLRQHGRRLGHRRGLHARPVDRRQRRSTASSCPTPRARTSSRAFARR